MDSGEESPSSLVTDGEQTALLTQYQEIREEARMEMREQRRRLTRAIGAGGIVTGYGLVSGEFVYFSLVPGVLAFIFLLGIIGHHSVLLLAWHSADIESRLPYETFSWEQRYGMLSPDNRRSHIDPWGKVPILAVLTVSGTIYGGSMVAGYYAIRGADLAPVAGVPVSDLVVVVYTLLTLLVGVVVYAHRRATEEIQNRL